MPLSPPVFVPDGGDMLIFDSVQAAESYLEPVDVRPDERAYDAEARALLVRVVGKIKKGWLWRIDRSRERVEIVLAEETPAYAAELRAELVRWLTAVEGAEPAGSLADLVRRARRHAAK